MEQPSALYFQQAKQSTFHNLCNTTTITLPTTINSLLGLGLNFCPMPATTTPLISIEIDRFEKDYNRRLFFANQPAREFTRVLYVKNELWRAPTPNNSNLHLRGNNFHSEINNLFHQPTAATPNLLPSQQQALKWLLDHPELVVMSTDKNLGPAIIERERYVFYKEKRTQQDTTLSTSSVQPTRSTILTNSTNISLDYYPTFR